MDFKLSAQGVAWGFVNKLNLIKLSRFLPSTLQTESPSIFLGREEEGTSADILDNSYWACSKFNFFLWRQSNRNRSIHFVRRQYKRAEAANVNVTGSFSPFRTFVSSRFGSEAWK